MNTAMIQHVTREIVASKLDECVHFYGLLGFQPVSVPAGIAGRAVWLQLGPTQLHLIMRADAQPQAGHVGVVVARYEETLARLRRDGHEAQPRREHWGSPRAYVEDPARNLVELMASGPDERTPTSLHRDEQR